MTSSGRLWALLIAAVIAFALPKRVECGFPGNECSRIVRKERCVMYEVEPFGFFWLEHLFDRDIGFAYKTDEECR